jgi:putative intracellular protease/amidase
VQVERSPNISVKDYDAIFYVGGHGPAIDLPIDADNIKLATEVRSATPGSASEA